jgi:hypothetical protein
MRVGNFAAFSPEIFEFSDIGSTSGPNIIDVGEMNGGPFLKKLGRPKRVGFLI